MGLRRGTISFSRYRLIGEKPDHLTDFFNERIRKHAFRTDWRTADEKAAGWTGLEDPLDTDFPFASYAQGRYLLFSLRVDRKSIAPSLLRLKVMEAERKQLAQSGQKKLYREQRDAIREAVRLELLGRSLPVPSSFEVCWSVPDNTLIFASLSDNVLDDLRELFRDSFQLTLCPYVPWERQLPGETQTPHSAGPAPSAAAPSDVDPLTIGREFLTWLWFKSEERNGTVLIPGVGETEIIFMRRLVLESGDGEYIERVVCQGMHTDLKEGKEALRQGKKITQARLRIAHDKTEWEFTFKGDRFHFQSMKLPTLPENEGEETDREGALLERIYLIERAVEMMDLLFQSFLGLRISGGWGAEQARLAKWIAQPQAND